MVFNVSFQTNVSYNEEIVTYFLSVASSTRLPRHTLVSQTPETKLATQAYVHGDNQTHNLGRQLSQQEFRFLEVGRDPAFEPSQDILVVVGSDYT